MQSDVFRVVLPQAVMQVETKANVSFSTGIRHDDQVDTSVSDGAISSSGNSFFCSML